jgi:SAM-dependent methyltransferase
MDAAEPAASTRSDGFWDVYSRVYDGVYHLIPYRGLLWDAYEALELEPGMRVLDAGCGTGNFEHFIAEKSPPLIAIDAVDASAGMLDIARRKCRDLEYVRFSAGDLNGRLPYDDATFDRVLSINVLYALADQDHLIVELLRVLKPDGRLVISSPLPTYSVSPMVADHFRRIRNVWGVRRRMARFAESLWVLATNGLVQWLLNNLVIDSREADGQYHSLDRSDLEALLRRRAIDGLGDIAIRLASADQNLFATAVKGVAA